jgi:hypothetical protein
LLAAFAPTSDIFIETRELTVSNQTNMEVKKRDDLTK